MNIFKRWQRFGDWLMHKTVFHSRVGEVDFYGLTEDEAPDTDGQVIVLDRRTNQRIAYAFRFENRYMVYRPVGNRVMAVFQALYRIDGLRPLAMIENDSVYTPFGHYTGVPKSMRDTLLPV